LTYPQSDFDLQEFSNYLQTLADYKYSIVSSEKHQDDSLHRHAVVHFIKKQRLSSSYFDYLGRHPNVKPVGKKKSDWTNTTTYVRKDGEFIEHGIPRHEVSVWAEVANATNREDALQLLKTEKPRDFVLQQRNIDYYLDKVFPVQQSASYIGRSADQFVLPDTLQEWLLESYQYVVPPHSPQGGLFLVSNISDF